MGGKNPEYASNNEIKNTKLIKKFHTRPDYFNSHPRSSDQMLGSNTWEKHAERVKSNSTEKPEVMH